MKTKLIKIGNSQGIRLPKVILHQIGIDEELDLEVKKDRIILKPIHETRTGWDKAFQKMASQNDDQLLDGEQSNIQNTWDVEDWIWETE